jgi:hypothetical protein
VVFTTSSGSEGNADVGELLRRLGVCIETDNGRVECVKVKKVVIEVQIKDVEEGEAMGCGCECECE